jgi:hypothetical protein
MPRRTPDWADRLCMGWAEQRRKALGIVLPSKLEPRERLGKLTCTLGAVREEGEGASYSGKTQNWPEVYTGDSLLVHRCWSGMQRPWAEVMHVHYVWREIHIKDRIEAVKLDFTEYYKRLGLLKSHVEHYVNGDLEPQKPYKIQGVRYFLAVNSIS